MKRMTGIGMALTAVTVIGVGYVHPAAAAAKQTAPEKTKRARGDRQSSEAESTEKTIVDEKLAAIRAAEYRNIYAIGASLLMQKHYPAAAALLDRLDEEKDSEFIDDRLRAGIERSIAMLRSEEQKVSEGRDKTRHESFLKSATSKKIYDAHLKRYNTTVVDGTIREYLKLIRWCARDTRHKERVDEIAGLILGKNPNHAEARKILGHVRIEPYGWVDTEQAGHINDGLTRVGQDWLSKEQIAGKKGQFTTSFHFQDGTSSHSFIIERCSRGGIAQDGTTYTNHALDIDEEKYNVVVPPNYDGTEKFGLIVFVSPVNGNRLNGGYIKALGKHRMLYAGAFNSGNKKQVSTRRMPLALAAVLNMKLRYNIDDTRVYISGLSGGGRVASRMAMGFPDIFTGAFYMMGCDPHRLPALTTLADSLKNRSRFVLMTGDKDFNNRGTKVVHGLYDRYGFLNTWFVSIPKWGHRMPSSEYFDRGLHYLITGEKS